jgi:hypothetical protein
MDRRVVLSWRRAGILAAVGIVIGLCQVVFASDRQAPTDVRCVVVGLRMVEMTAPQARAAGMMLSVYYLGRLDSRVPDAEVEGLIEKEAREMTEAQFRANAVRCGKALTLKGREIQKIGADLTRKVQGGAAPK